MNEAEALRACKAGDKDAFRHLVEEYGDFVRRTAYLLVRDRVLADDLAQEAFLHAWRGLDGLRTEVGFKPWIVRILLNRVASSGRRKSLPLTSLDALAIWDQPVDPEPGPAERAEMAERSAQISEALSRLPEEWRQAMVLRYYADLSVPEIATALGWAEGTVKSRLHRALEALRRAMDGEMSKPTAGGRFA